MTKRIFSILILALALCSSGCRTTGRSGQGETVYFPWTSTYHRQLQTLPINEEEARSRLVAHLAARQEDDFWARSLTAIVGDSFLFSCLEKAGVDLRGYYVNGRTGAVSFRDSPIPRKVLPPFGTKFDHLER